MFRFLLFVTIAGLGYAEDAVRVTPCELAAKPADYHQKLIDVTGSFSRGFELSSLSDPSCTDSRRPYLPLWFDYGNRSISDLVGRHRKDSNPLLGFKRTLVKDSLFRSFDKSFRQGGSARPSGTVPARVVARFFAGGGAGRGFGHLSCCHLVLIQQVLEVASRQ
jgi:hypothetical protein